MRGCVIDSRSLMANGCLAGGSITSILTHRNLYDTSFAAYYQPWVIVSIDAYSSSRCLLRATWPGLTPGLTTWRRYLEGTRE